MSRLGPAVGGTADGSKIGPRYCGPPGCELCSSHTPHSSSGKAFFTIESSIASCALRASSL